MPFRTNLPPLQVDSSASQQLLQRLRRQASHSEVALEALRRAVAFSEALPTSNRTSSSRASREPVYSVPPQSLLVVFSEAHSSPVTPSEPLDLQVVSLAASSKLKTPDQFSVCLSNPSNSNRRHSSLKVLNWLPSAATPTGAPDSSPFRRLSQLRTAKTPASCSASPDLKRQSRFHRYLVRCEVHQTWEDLVPSSVALRTLKRQTRHERVFCPAVDSACPSAPVPETSSMPQARLFSIRTPSHPVTASRS